MYCQNCGKMQENGSAVCADCGAELIGKNDYGRNNKKSFCFALLSFVFPIAGFILYLIYEDRKPARARSLIVGFIIGITVKLLFVVALSVLMGVGVTQPVDNSNLWLDGIFEEAQILV